MKTVLFLVLLFVGSYALRSNSGLRRDKDATKMSENKTPDRSGAKGKSADKAEPKGKSADKAGAKGKSADKAGAKDEGSNMDYPPISEVDKKLLEIHDQRGKEEIDVINNCVENLRKCFEKVGEDKDKRAKCDEDYEKEKKEGFAKIQDIFKNKVHDLVGKIDHEHPHTPEENCLKNIEIRLRDALLFRVQDKFFDFIGNLAKDFGDEGRIQLEDAGAKAEEALKEEIDELEKTGNNWFEARFAEFKKKVNEKREKGSKEVPTGMEVEFEEAMNKDVDDFMANDEKFKALFQKFKERVHEKVKELQEKKQSKKQ